MDGWIVAFTIPVSIAFVFSTIWFTQKINDNDIVYTNVIEKKNINNNNTILAF
jgi:hypothetical protein